MEIIKISILSVVLYAQVSNTLESSFGEDRDVWSATNWKEEPSEEGFALRFTDFMKRSKSQQFHESMGRSAGTAQPLRLGRRRNKGEMFVGLMGRRSSNGEFEEEWDKPQFY